MDRQHYSQSSHSVHHLVQPWSARSTWWTVKTIVGLCLYLVASLIDAGVNSQGNCWSFFLKTTDVARITPKASRRCSKLLGKMSEPINPYLYSRVVSRYAPTSSSAAALYHIHGITSQPWFIKSIITMCGLIFPVIWRSVKKHRSTRDPMVKTNDDVGQWVVSLNVGVNGKKNIGN